MKRGTQWLTKLLLLAASAIAFGACGDGEPGKVFGMFVWETDVTEMNLTDVGPDVKGELPDADRFYPLSTGEASVLWTANGNQYILSVSIDPNAGEEVGSFDFSKGEDGADKYYLFNFSGDELSVSPLIRRYTGVNL